MVGHASFHFHSKKWNCRFCSIQGFYFERVDFVFSSEHPELNSCEVLPCLSLNAYDDNC